MKKNTSNLQSVSARERILLTAHDLFYADGINATGIDKIIKQAQVTKVTFYRHYPSKRDLIVAFLDYRHQLWMSWFTQAIERHDNKLDGVVMALEEWFETETFRGCAFINSVSELGNIQPEIMTISKQHKQDMTAVISPLLKDNSYADAIAVAIDGAIIKAQIDQTPDTAIKALKQIIRAIQP